MTDIDIENFCAASSRVANLTLGFHECEFCPPESAFRGNGEYHYYLSGGDVFAAPVMILHYLQEHDYRLPEEFREGWDATATLFWDGRAERLCEVLADDSQDADFRCLAITDLPHWRDYRAFRALALAIQDEELVETVGYEIGRSLTAYMSCDFAAEFNPSNLPDIVKFGMGLIP